MNLKNENIGIFLIYALSLLSFVNYNLSNYVLCLIILYTVINYEKFRDYYLKEKIINIFFIYILYILISAISFYYIFPETYKSQIYSVLWWIAPWTFIFISWIIQGKEKIIYNTFIFSILGFILRIIIKADWILISEFIPGYRYKVGFPFLLTSLYCGLFLSCLYIFRKDLKLKKTIVLVPIVSLVIFLFFILALSQSRGMFILLILLLLFSLIHNIKIFYEKKIETTIIILFILVFTASQYKMINSRMSEEKLIYNKILLSEISEIPYTSIGARIHLFDYALSLVKQRPFFGWGPGTSATQYLTAREDVRYPLKDKFELSNFSHLHNIFLEISVRFGVVGLIIHLLILFYFVKTCFIGEINIFEDKIYTFFLTFSFLNISFNMYDYRYIYKDYRYVIIVFLGIFFSRYILLKKIKRYLHSIT